MSDVERKQDNPSQDWQKADARVLGQILAAQNVVFALPDTIRIAEFYAQILISIPGITACRVCLGAKSVQAGEMASGVCAECETLRHLAREEDMLKPTKSSLKCNLADQPEMRVIAIDSYQHRFGFFVFKINQAAVGELYQPFICNLSNYVALILENRRQKDLLQKAHDESERKVEERTYELTAANEALSASRLTALDMMNEAIEARRRAEQASADLQREIAERKRAEEKLKISEERLRLTLEATQIGIFDWNIEQGSWYASSEYYTMLGYDPKDSIGDRKELLELVHLDDRAHVEAKIQQVLAGNSSANPSQEYTYEARMRHADGTYRWQHVKGIGVKRDCEGRMTRMLGIRMDVHERKTAEEKIHQLNRELDQRVKERTAELEVANRELEAFAYSVSHDLRAPLRHIDGFLEFLKVTIETALDRQSRHYMDAISHAANKMSLLIDDLLSFSRMGRHAMSLRHVNLGNLVREVIRDLEPDAAGRNIEWRIRDLPSVGGDAAMLRMVLDNLILNALKFTRARQQARIEIGSLPGQASETVIFVRDNGVGFDMTYVDKLFGVFQRLHRAEEFEGTGIGLANVRRIITRHGGRTWARGEPDHGAVFFFSLPHTPQRRGDDRPAVA